MSTRRRHRRIKINSGQLACLCAAVVVLIVVGRAASGQAASWLDVVMVGMAAVTVLIVVSVRPRRRRAPVKGRSILSAEVRQQQRTDNQVLSGGHGAWAPPAQRAEPSAAPRTHAKISMRLAVAEELLAAHGLTAEYRHMVSAVEQDGEAEQAG